MKYIGLSTSDAAYATVTQPGGMMQSSINMPAPGCVLNFADFDTLMPIYYPDSGAGSDIHNPLPWNNYVRWTAVGAPLEATREVILNALWGQTLKMEAIASGSFPTRYVNPGDPTDFGPATGRFELDSIITADGPAFGGTVYDVLFETWQMTSSLREHPYLADTGSMEASGETVCPGFSYTKDSDGSPVDDSWITGFVHVTCDLELLVNPSVMRFDDGSMKGLIYPSVTFGVYGGPLWCVATNNAWDSFQIPYFDAHFPFGLLGYSADIFATTLATGAGNILGTTTAVYQGTLGLPGSPVPVIPMIDSLQINVFVP